MKERTRNILIGSGIVVPGAEHGMSYYVDKNGYEENLNEFWNDYD